MTAEIAILNKRGIVLASDSASTIGGNKVYNTAKKNIHFRFKTFYWNYDIRKR